MSSETALDLWQSFRRYLRVELEFVDNGAATVTVSNDAPISHDLPTILFEDLKLRPTGGRVVGHNREFPLRPGESVQFELSIDELATIRVEVTGSVSRREFFGIRQAVDAPIEVTRPVVQEYLAGLEALDVIEICERTRALMTSIGPDTALGALEDLPPQLTPLQEHLNNVNEFRVCSVPAVGGDVFDCIRPYLGAVGRGVRNAINAIDKGDVKELQAAIDSVQGLVPPGDALTAKIAEVRAAYGLSR